MAFNASQVDYYGSGKNGSLTPTVPDFIVNDYAKVTKVRGKTLTLDNYTNADAFTVGTLVLVHFAASTSSDNLPELGAWKVSRITAVEGNTITVKKTITGISGGASDWSIQVVTVPEFSTVTLNKGASITCPPFDSALGRGGIVTFQCSEDLILNGGHITLNGKGVPNATLRPAHPFESDQNKTGYENYKRKDYLPLNFPDGAALVLTKKLTCTDTSSRLGNPNASGEKRTLLRDGQLGGASITLVAETIEGFDVQIISRKPSASNGKGVSGCYIATESEIPCDEGTYSYDRISNPNRLVTAFKVTGFGDGSQGDRSNYTRQLNSYAHVTKIDSSRKVFTVNMRDDGGLAPLAEGSLVMVRADRKEGGGYYQHVGRFVLTTVLQVNQDKITVADSFPDWGNMSTGHYNFQIVSIPQFTNFTLSQTNEATPKYENGRGGIVAIACNDTCNLSGGKLLVEGKGGANPLLERGLDFISNAMMAEKLPIGQGNGSVFILANNLILDENTRLGASWTGKAYGGAPAFDTRWPTGYGNENNKEDGAGSRAGTYTDSEGNIYRGGYNRNAYRTDSNGTTTLGANQGAHILVIANKITNMNLAPFSTGGQRGGHSGSSNRYDAEIPTNGGCGYGGAGGVIGANIGASYTKRGGLGGYIGGGGGTSRDNGSYALGGGSGAFCFVYCNSVENVDYSLISVDD